MGKISVRIHLKGKAIHLVCGLDPDGFSPLVYGPHQANKSLKSSVVIPNECALILLSNGITPTFIFFSGVIRDLFVSYQLTMSSHVLIRTNTIVRVHEITTFSVHTRRASTIVYVSLTVHSWKIMNKINCVELFRHLCKSVFLFIFEQRRLSQIFMNYLI